MVNKHRWFKLFGTILTCLAGYTLIMKCCETTAKYEKMKVCKVCLVHFTEHHFHISYIMSFYLRWWFFLMKRQKFLEENQNFMKMAKRVQRNAYTFHNLFLKTPRNTAGSRKYDKCVAGLTKVEHYICTEPNLWTTLYYSSCKFFFTFITGECSSEQLELMVFVDHKFRILLDRCCWETMLVVELPNIILSVKFQSQTHTRSMLRW